MSTTETSHSSASYDPIAGNRRYVADQHDPTLPGPPRRRLAVIACMDARLDVLPVLGLSPGDAHVIRNAGGVITDDVIRSLCLSQRFLGTNEVILVHHTDCGLQKVDEHQLRAELLDEVGMSPPWSFDSFADPYQSVEQSFRRLRHSPFVFETGHLRGFVFDVATGVIHEVDDPAS